MTEQRTRRSGVRGLQHLGDRAADHDLAAEDAQALHVEVAELLGHPLGRELVGGLGLLSLAERRDGGDGALAGVDRLVADEARLLGEGLGHVAIDEVHERIDRSLADTVRPDAHEHGAPLSWRPLVQRYTRAATLRYSSSWSLRCHAP